MSPFTSIRYTGSDGLALQARDYAPTAAAPAGMAAAPGRLPVVCIHGLTRNAADFDEFAPIVAGLGRRVLAPDVRGRGDSARDANPDNYNTQVYADDVERLLAQLGIGRAIFVGTSMGGLITMTLAGRNLDLIAAAVLNDIGPVISHKGLARIAGYVGRQAAPASWDEAAAHMQALNACAFPDNDPAEWAKWARRAFAPDAAGRLAPRYDPGIAKAMQTGKLRTTSPALRKAFRRLAHERPVLLVRGALSDLVEPRQAAWMRRAAPAMQYAEVPGVGHAPMLTEPAALEAVVRFLAEQP
ncbi:alpha/beta fold hydrolase [uncultured Massilia sp.]|uniref:alpha/beta fold hydrolase n=1 Tax=uncultured Massilia sp. TaxID=169973 RepID=UPI0025DDADAE|nr:alpha/beta hydrolase [uncultured Massilia sp.]